MILNRMTNSLEEKTRHTRDFYINQEANQIESQITKKAQKWLDPKEASTELLTIAEQGERELAQAQELDE